MLPGRRQCDSRTSRLPINFPQGKAQHMGGDIGRPQQMAEEFSRGPQQGWGEGVASRCPGLEVKKAESKCLALGHCRAFLT